VQHIAASPPSSIELPPACLVSLICQGTNEAHVRAPMLHGLSIGALHLHHLDSAKIKNDDRVAVTAAITADDRPTRRSN
jgi:virulence factor MgtC-like protein